MAGTRLYVGNLNNSTTEEGLREAFGADGRVVKDVYVVIDRDTGRPRGFAFVEMGSPADCQSAVEAMDGADLEGRALKVNEARERTTSRPSGGGGGGYAGGGGGGGYAGDGPPPSDDKGGRCGRGRGSNRGSRGGGKSDKGKDRDRDRDRDRKRRDY